MKPTISKITDKWIEEKRPCIESLEWWDKKERDPIKILKKLIKAEKYDWANWFIVRIMTKHDYVSYAIYAAEQVIDIYEKKYPDDKRPRVAIEEAKKYLKNPNAENKDAANAAANAAFAAAYTAYAAAYAANAAANAAFAAAYTAYAAAYASAAAYAAADAAAAAYAANAANAAYAAADAAAYTARKEMKVKILKYGIKLITRGFDR